MKIELPNEKTKSYWENQFPNLMQQYTKKSFYKTLCSVFIIFLIFVIKALFDSNEDSFAGWIVLGLIFIVFSIIVLIIVFYYPLLQTKIRGEDPLCIEEMTFYDIESMYGHVYGSYPEKDPINKLFPDNMIVSQFALYYKIDKRKYKYLRKRCLFFIGTKEKYDELNKLIHMKEGIVPRKESRSFCVKYRKHSRELVEIQLSKNEEYPNISCYEDCIECINSMF